jgi:hypothetical protein
MDQNEELGRWKIFVLAAVDGFSRYYVHHQVGTCLTGPAHSDFFEGALRKMGILPRAVSVDGTSTNRKHHIHLQF